jgi:hypothetical protein
MVKSKPWRDWREFLWEIVTIVIGVLLALGAGQMVDALHWKDEVAAERLTLRDEVRQNLAATAKRVSQRACIERRLDQLGEVFRRQARGEPLGIIAPVTRPTVFTYTQGSWQIALAEQALGHMPLKEKLAYSDAFESFRIYTDLRHEEDEIWRRLGLLDHPEILAAGDWVALHQAWGEAVAIDRRMIDHTTYVLSVTTMGEQPAKLDLWPQDIAAEKAFCAPLIR